MATRLSVSKSSLSLYTSPSIVSSRRKFISACRHSVAGVCGHGLRSLSSRVKLVKGRDFHMRLNLPSDEVVDFVRARPVWQERDRVVVCMVKMDSESEGRGEELMDAERVVDVETEVDDPLKSVKQVVLWVMAAVYTSWLFLLPYAPGDPVWAISPATIRGILNLSLNFFYVLPLANMVGFHLLEAAGAHPADEALFNFVLAWAFLFAPLIFTDKKRDRFKGSLDIFWLISMFLTNTVFIPYMAIRLSKRPKRNSKLLDVAEVRGLDSRYETTALQRAITNGAHLFAATGAAVGILSIVWFIIGRPTECYGDLAERWNYFVKTVFRDRPTYAFIWDMCCYTVFQPWLIGDNLHNLRTERREIVQELRFLPYVGLITYCWSLHRSQESDKTQDKLQ